jgi:riboflavin biosynthesis pyrimidine reductase
VADVVLCGEETVDLAEVRSTLVARGLTRILCEGGPTFFADLLRSGEVDELCLSITPLLAGPGPGRITAGHSWPGDPAAAQPRRSARTGRHVVRPVRDHPAELVFASAELGCPVFDVDLEF